MFASNSQPRGAMVMVAAAALLLAAPNAQAGDNCEPQWDNTIGQPGTDEFVAAVTVYNGDLIVGGFFFEAGGLTVNSIARWDGTSGGGAGGWHPLASGAQVGVQAEHLVSALAVYNGDLVAGGNFGTAGGQVVSGIARWDGSAWHPLDSGVAGLLLDAHVSALAVYNGDLIVGGWFTSAGGQTANNIARWDGSQWHPLISEGQNGLNGSVLALTVHNGDLIAGGTFIDAGSQVVNRIARWDGSAWHPLASGGDIGVTGNVFNVHVAALASHNGDLIAGGDFAVVGGHSAANNIARWDGSAWHLLTSGGESGVSAQVFALAAYNGDLIVGGFLESAGDLPVDNIVRWDGAEWHPLMADDADGVNSAVMALAVYDEALIVGGLFTEAGGQPANRIAQWQGCPATTPEFPVRLDIKPGNCPKTLNLRSKGVLPAAIAGMNGFDVNAIDTMTLALSRADGVGGSVAPLMGPPGPGISIADVTSPSVNDACACDDSGILDGIDDLVLKFPVPMLVEQLALGDLAPGEEVELVITGELFDGTPFHASDCVKIVGPKQTLSLLLQDWNRSVAPGATGDLNGDGVVDALDLLMLLSHWR